MAKVTFPKADLWHAIRDKCMDCSNGQFSEVENCPITRCPLYLYRFGNKSAAKMRENVIND